LQAEKIQYSSQLLLLNFHLVKTYITSRTILTNLSSQKQKQLIC